jgi:ATP-dependent Clp protease ATP-binding subunit ClpA
MVFFARYWAAKRGSETIEPEHVLRGLLQEDADFMRRLLRNSFPSERILAGVDQAGGWEFARTFASTQPTPLSNESTRVLRVAAGEADRMGHRDITIGHFWLALLSEENMPAMSILIEILKENGLSISTARDRIEDLIREEC